MLRRSVPQHYQLLGQEQGRDAVKRVSKILSSRYIYIGGAACRDIYIVYERPRSDDYRRIISLSKL